MIRAPSLCSSHPNPLRDQDDASGVCTLLRPELPLISPQPPRQGAEGTYAVHYGKRHAPAARTCAGRALQQTPLEAGAHEGRSRRRSAWSQAIQKWRAHHEASHYGRDGNAPVNSVSGVLPRRSAQHLLMLHSMPHRLFRSALRFIEFHVWTSEAVCIQASNQGIKYSMLTSRAVFPRLQVHRLQAGRPHGAGAACRAASPSAAGARWGTSDSRV